MTGWIIFACIVLVLFLISLIRVGGLAQYSAEGLLAQVKAGPLRITVYPVKPKAPKKKKEKTKIVGKEPEEEPSKPGGSVAVLKRYLPLAAEAAGQFKRKVRIDRLYLDFIAASSDAASTALTFGRANAAIGMILPLFEHNFHVKERRIRTAADFNADKSTVFVHAELSLTIGQMGVLGVRLFIRFLKITLKARAAQKTEKEAV
jgi:hypothetical protein